VFQFVYVWTSKDLSMYIPFEEMSPHSRVWIYQADRLLSNKEVSFIEDCSKQFLSEWAAHGNALKSSFSVLHNKFLVISNVAIAQAIATFIDEQWPNIGICTVLSDILSNS